MSEVHHRLVEAGTLHFNVFEWGTIDQPLLVLLHGLASSSHMFDLLAPLLAADYHILAYDQRGHGLSDKPDTGYDFETIAADLDNILAVLKLGGTPFVLAGHSWGASTALYYAATRPEKVAQVILIDGGLRPVSDHFARVEDMAPPQHHKWPLNDVKRMIRQDWLGTHWKPVLEPLVLTIYDASDPRDVHPHLSLANHMRIAHALWDFQARELLPELHCALLIISAFEGTSPDPAMVPYVTEAQTLARESVLVWMPSTIHDIPWQRPHELARIMLGFLKKTPMN